MTGFAGGSGASDELALEFLEKAPATITGNIDPARYFPNFIEKYNKLDKIYGSNYLKLRQQKSKYDPRGKLNKEANSFIPPI
jgi:hypothetical protein